MRGRDGLRLFGLGGPGVDVLRGCGPVGRRGSGSLGGHRGLGGRGRRLGLGLGGLRRRFRLGGLKADGLRLGGLRADGLRLGGLGLYVLRRAGCQVRGLDDLGTRLGLGRRVDDRFRCDDSFRCDGLDDRRGLHRPGRSGFRDEGGRLCHRLRSRLHRLHRLLGHGERTHDGYERARGRSVGNRLLGRPHGFRFRGLGQDLLRRDVRGGCGPGGHDLGRRRLDDYGLGSYGLGNLLCGGFGLGGNYDLGGAGRFRGGDGFRRRGHDRNRCRVRGCGFRRHLGLSGLLGRYLDRCGCGHRHERLRERRGNRGNLRLRLRLGHGFGRRFGHGLSGDRLRNDGLRNSGVRDDRFCCRRLRGRGLRLRRRGGLLRRLGRPLADALRRDLAELRARECGHLVSGQLEVLGFGGRRAGVPCRRLRGWLRLRPALRLRRTRRTAVGQGTDHAAAGRTPVGGTGIRGSRAAVQRAAHGRLGLRRCRDGRRDAHAAEVDMAGVPAAGLMGALTGPLDRRGGLLHGVRRDLGLLLELDRALRAAVALGHRLRLRGGRSGAVPALLGQRCLARLSFAPGTLGARHQQEIVVLGRVLGGVEEGVGTRGGGARLLHHACVLRQSLARDLAGVTHAYPSPIVSAPSALRPGRPDTARRCSSHGTSGRAARHESVADILHSRGRSPPRQVISPRLVVDCATLRVPRFCRTTTGAKTVPFSGH